MNSNTPSPSAQQTPLPPLPELKVIRDTYCDQEMTDTVIRFLQEKRPDLVEAMTHQLKLEQNSMYDRRINAALHYLQTEASKEIEIPETRLGRLDLMWELTRRIAEVYGLLDVYLHGDPLAEGPDQPLPPLAPPGPFKEGHGITTALENTVAHLIYERRPDIIYELSEQMRRRMRIQEIDAQFFSFIHTELRPELGIRDDLGASTKLLKALRLRVHQMMGLPIPEWLTRQRT